MKAVISFVLILALVLFSFPVTARYPHISPDRFSSLKKVEEDQYCRKSGSFTRSAWRICGYDTVNNPNQFVRCFYCVDSKGQMYPVVDPYGPDENGNE
ncbi:MAG: hypothetical protein NTU97_03445 [Candidatus Magasanikbacteria bacterium]|nr:hypothetical protein [Candidatus Magasanikbacteria bacterium]